MRALYRSDPVSIRAPARGATILRAVRYGRYPYVSIRAPARGATTVAKTYGAEAKTEPARVFRRLFGLSYAAMGMASSWA